MGISAADVAMGLNVVVLASLVVVLGLLFSNSEQAQTATKNAATTRELAQELRVSSDDLTRFIRTYTVTVNSTYWDLYNEIINIRDGLVGLPVFPWRNWFDLLIETGREPRPRGPPSSLASRFVAAGFTDEELAYLREAKRQSDALIDVETVASNAMVGKYRPDPPGAANLSAAQRANFTITAPPNATWARGLVHDPFYHHWKGRVMRPIDEFAALSSARVDADLNHINVVNQVLLGILGAAIGLIIIVMLLFIFKLKKDQETAQLLNAVLPAYISQVVTPADVNALRHQATVQARAVRRQKAYLPDPNNHSNNKNKGKHNSAAAVATAASPSTDAQAFPVLYYENIPFLFISFVDMVSFTKICRIAPCGVIIATLNELFALMDAACVRFRIMKIKTIGDCQMSVKVPKLKSGGTSKADAKNISRCGMDMLRYLFHCFDLARSIPVPTPGETFSVEEKEAELDEVPIVEGLGMPFQDTTNDPSNSSAASTPRGEAKCALERLGLPKQLELRAGLNAGPCASGVIGFDKFQYDVFGPTITTASAIESAGKPSLVHTSVEVLRKIADFENKELIEVVPESEGGYRKMNIRGVGMMDTVLIHHVRNAPGNDAGSTVSNADRTNVNSNTNTNTAATASATASRNSEMANMTPRSNNNNDKNDGDRDKKKKSNMTPTAVATSK